MGGVTGFGGTGGLGGVTAAGINLTVTLNCEAAGDDAGPAKHSGDHTPKKVSMIKLNAGSTLKREQFSLYMAFFLGRWAIQSKTENELIRDGQSACDRASK